MQADYLVTNPQIDKIYQILLSNPLLFEANNFLNIFNVLAYKLQLSANVVNIFNVNVLCFYTQRKPEHKTF